MNRYNPIISVVMPVYNAEKYLKEAIDSILNQTFGDFEFIIVNDGSNDRSEEIINEYSDKRIIHIKQENTGIGGALRNGCNIARGKYIARMDADDVSLPERFRVQFDFLEKNRSCVLVSNSVLFIDENSKIFGRSFSTITNRAIKKKLRRGSVISHPSVMMRNDIYKKTIGYQELQPLEDYCLWMNMLKHGKLHNISSPLLKYRVLSNSISRSITKEKYAELINFVRERNFIISNDDLLIFKQIYANAKKEYSRNANTNNPNKIELNSPLEVKLHKTLTKWCSNDKLIESIICNIKSILC